MFIFPHDFLAENFDMLSVEIDRIKNNNLKIIFGSFCEIFNHATGIVEAEEEMLHLYYERVRQLEKERTKLYQDIDNLKDGKENAMSFKSVQKKIAKKQGISAKRAGAILAAGTRGASEAAKRRNPKLRRVK